MKIITNLFLFVLFISSFSASAQVFVGGKEAKEISHLLQEIEVTSYQRAFSDGVFTYRSISEVKCSTVTKDCSFFIDLAVEGEWAEARIEGRQAEKLMEILAAQSFKTEEGFGADSIYCSTSDKYPEPSCVLHDSMPCYGL